MTELGPAKPITPCEAVRKLPYATPEQLQQRRSYTSLETAVASFENELNAARKKDEDTHAANAAPIEHNRAMRAHVEAIMDKLGINKSYRQRAQNRYGGLGKVRTVDAGYLADLRHHFPVTDEWIAAQSVYERYLKALEETKVKVQQQKEHAAGEAERKREVRRRDMALAALMVRYKLSKDADWHDALANICSRDKYVRLGVAGQRVRVHGSEELWRVRDAMDAFTIENDVDKSIATSWAMRLSQYDDHRDFRDGEWGYDNVMMRGDAQVAADARTCLEHMEG